MNAYEKMRNAFLVEIEEAMPGCTTEMMQQIGTALDRAARYYDVTTKATALSADIYPLPQLVKTYIVTKKAEGLADGSLRNYLSALRHFFQWCRKDVNQVTANDIRIYLYEYSQYRHVSDRTLDKYRAFICWFFNWAHAEEYIQRNPARTIKAIKYEIKERQSLSQLELEYLRRACTSDRDAAILEFFYSTGCRVSELIHVQRSDVNWATNTVHLYGKGRKHRTSYLNAKAQVALKAYLKGRTDTNPHLFVVGRAPYNALRKEAVEYVIRRLSNAAGMGNRVTPHVLRHTTATQAVNSGMPIEDVSKLLGHASLNTTMIYAKPSSPKIQAEHIRYVV